MQRKVNTKLISKNKIHINSFARILNYSLKKLIPQKTTRFSLLNVILTDFLFLASFALLKLVESFMLNIKS